MINPGRYHSLAICLHWLMALGLVFMVVSGLYMVNFDMPRADQFKLYQTHKAAGVLMLVAIVMRIVVRVFSKQPVLPPSIPQAEQRLAKLGHVALYCLLVAVPVAGWVMVSASPFGLPTFVFVDWLKWPHIPGIERNKEVESLAKAAHWYFALAMMLFVAAHVCAVIWHKKKQGINLVKRMWWSK